MAPSHVLITGASSGIGEALALQYAAPDVTLSLIGRDRERLAATAAGAHAKGSEVQVGLIDVRDQAAMAKFIAAADASRPIDLAIANAGITTGLAPDEFAESPDAVRAIVSINLIGVFNTAEPLIAPMCMRKRGQIAFIGSIAGLRGLPYAPAYCATKAAVHAYSESLRGRLAGKGVEISLVIPGFVKTPLNDGISAIKPLEISAKEAAYLIKRGLDRHKAIIAFPKSLYWLARLSRILPIRLVDKVMAGFNVNIPRTHERIR
ncbi:MAG TPA: SDR family NAD(P)-dependent oxidoreductase [Methylocella sp.]|nr:SDR family NAD(P)-dependent oxidoreductase [Methylocella sp.]